MFLKMHLKKRKSFYVIINAYHFLSKKGGITISVALLVAMHSTGGGFSPAISIVAYKDVQISYISAQNKNEVSSFKFPGTYESKTNKFN